jgi:polyribonucleotide nucleotidyltransferase
MLFRLCLIKEQEMTKKYLSESIKLGAHELIVETGKVAKQADGSVVIRYGDTMLLVAAVSARTAREGLDFFPLTVEYRENTFAAGRIPGNYFRREGRPSAAALRRRLPF